MSRLRFRRTALADLVAIRRFLTQERPDAANRLARELIDRADLLPAFPDAGEPRPRLGRGIRRLTQSPFLILFRVSDGEVTILRILQDARRITRRLLREG